MSFVQCRPFYPASVFNQDSDNFSPDLDVAEEGNQYLMTLDVPGVNKEDVQVSYDNGVLTVQGERKTDSEEKNRSYYRIERSFGKFIRRINLGTGVDAQAIKANYKDGVLTITVPKSEKAKPVEINVG